jgi:hypothetical protein
MLLTGPPGRCAGGLVTPWPARGPGWTSQDGPSDIIILGTDGAIGTPRIVLSVSSRHVTAAMLIRFNHIGSRVIQFAVACHIEGEFDREGAHERARILTRCPGTLLRHNETLRPGGGSGVSRDR